MKFNKEFEALFHAFKEIEADYDIDETLYVQHLLTQVNIAVSLWPKIEKQTQTLINKMRSRHFAKSWFQFDLLSEQGNALMCLVEALLRIPDKPTQDLLIQDKFEKLKRTFNSSWWMNIASWVLNKKTPDSVFMKVFKPLFAKSAQPLASTLAHKIIQVFSQQFVMEQTIAGALKKARAKQKGYRYSYDMLGEAAHTVEDAQRYFLAYQQAIEAIASHSQGPVQGPGISVKLSALHPRFSLSQCAQVKAVLLPKLLELALQAKKANIGLTIDAEEAQTLTLTLELLQALMENPQLNDWHGLGIAVQAYQKRALKVIDWLILQARKNNKQLMVRLVKGAYWDSEIKLAQIQGLKGYPVFTRKVTTDVNYLACAQKLLTAQEVIYPQFATHNALTFATILTLIREKNIEHFEFQCLHGMGEALYDQVVSENIPCRIYAPIGNYHDLLPYLVRRLLENGANSSFLNRLQQGTFEIVNPISQLRSLESKVHPQIPLPIDLFSQRANSQGVNLSCPSQFLPLLQQIEDYKVHQASPLWAQGLTREHFSPINQQYLGKVIYANAESALKALENSDRAFAHWRLKPISERVALFKKVAELLKRDESELLTLLIYEGGKTIEDALNEVREAIDFCHYYALQADKHLPVKLLTGPTGERNQLSLQGRGVILCISPWNFPLAIFMGQLSAALLAGNCVLAKPASQTALIAAKAIALLHEAGFPSEVVQLLPAKGELVAQTLISDQRVKGILFTGSTQTARQINQQLAAREGPIIPLIAETGGQNAMIVDSSALIEQVTQDVITSAFRSAGQRCSALRVLFIQQDIADKLITMLKGALIELKMDHPGLLATDIGPLIDKEAKAQLEQHVIKMKSHGKLIAELPLTEECQNGSFFAPRIYEIDTLEILTQEVFGPILHIIRFERENLAQVIEQINQTGYGLTLGIHSRIEQTIEYICTHARVGNIYVNRNMIGAVVGVQPFGGEGLSGTGPKAGGPYYLPRLALERALSINTAASGGNATLLSLSD